MLKARAFHGNLHCYHVLTMNLVITNSLQRIGRGRGTCALKCKEAELTDAWVKSSRVRKVGFIWLGVREVRRVEEGRRFPGDQKPARMSHCLVFPSI